MRKVQLVVSLVFEVSPIWLGFVDQVLQILFKHSKLVCNFLTGSEV